MGNCLVRSLFPQLDCTLLCEYSVPSEYDRNLKFFATGRLPLRLPPFWESLLLPYHEQQQALFSSSSRNEVRSTRFTMARNKLGKAVCARLAFCKIPMSFGVEVTNKNTLYGCKVFRGRRHPSLADTAGLCSIPTDSAATDAWQRAE